MMFLARSALLRAGRPFDSFATLSPSGQALRREVGIRSRSFPPLKWRATTSRLRWGLERGKTNNCGKKNC
jgi:hypothetical protein